jgi:hypothetical protein
LLRKYNRSVNNTLGAALSNPITLDKALTGFYDSKGMGRMPNLTDNIAVDNSPKSK